MDWNIRIATCEKRTDARYTNRDWTWEKLKRKNRDPVRKTVKLAEYMTMTNTRKDQLKDNGGFVGGYLREGVRRNGYVEGRQVGCLDADNIPAGTDFIGLVRKALPDTEWFLYSTFKHTSARPRFRVVILFDKEITEDTYPAVMRAVASRIGMDFFDDTTYEPCRMMYWAACPEDSEFVFEENRGAPLDTGKILAGYDNWRDVTSWPTSSRQAGFVNKELRKQKDPLEKEGIIGIFCRTYFPIRKAMETFLPDIYRPTDKENRWSYVPSESMAGVVVYDDRFAYSHHATDPACGQLMNAYDLVRIHKFGNENPRESDSEMNRFALGLDEIKIALDRERQEKALDGMRVFTANPDAGRKPSAGPGPSADRNPSTDSVDRDWTKKLLYKPKTQELLKESQNLMIIFNNDPELQGFAKNEMADRIAVTGKLPWTRAENRFWTEDDFSQLKVYIDIKYAAFPKEVLDSCFRATAANRMFHPVRDYLKGLPPWDGVKRIETLFQRCLDAEDTPYIRAVARKTFAAAVARIMEKEVKFDAVPVLDGAQGIGKSSFFREICGSGFYNESLTLTDISDKSGAEKLQGYWIVEIGELAGMRKADIEKVKAFLSTIDDSYRPSYGRTVESHPRQCIIVATVNGERGYLRDITGNRRFWVIKCRQLEQKKKFSFTEEERAQIWAEAIEIRKSGEKLYLEDDILKESERVQRSAMEEDEREGMVAAYLDTLLPKDWKQMDLFERRRYLRNPDKRTGKDRRMKVSNAEIWSECFGNELRDMRKTDSYDIAAIITRIGGWEKAEKREWLPIYGQQRILVRTEM